MGLVDSFANMLCVENQIGVLGLCGETTYPILLDNYGVSLKTLSKSATSSLGTGLAQLTSIISDAVKETIADIRFDGLELGKVISTYSINQDTTTAYTLNGDNDITFSTTCENTAFYIGQITLKGNGDVTLSVIVDSVETILYTGAVVVSKTIQVNTKYTSDSVTIRLNGDEFVTTKVNEDCGTCSYITKVGQSYGLYTNISLRCDIDNYLCQYSDLIADVAKWKVLAKIFFNLHHSDRLNEYILFKESGDSAKIYELMSFYDSEMNMAYINGDTNVRPKGKYQLALANLNIPKPECTCCEDKCTDEIYFELVNL